MVNCLPVVFAGEHVCGLQYGVGFAPTVYWHCIKSYLGHRWLWMLLLCGSTDHYSFWSVKMHRRGELNSPLRRSEPCRVICCHQVVCANDGRMEWCVTTRGMQPIFGWLLHNELPFQAVLIVHSLSPSRNCTEYPFLKRTCFSSWELTTRFFDSMQILRSLHAWLYGMVVLQCLGWQLSMCKYWCMSVHVGMVYKSLSKQLFLFRQTLVSKNKT